MNVNSLMSIGGGRMPDFSAMRETMFQRADANGDKGLSLEEFRSVGQILPMGKNVGAVSSAEAFGEIDGDDNGSLSRDEMTSFGEKLSSQMQSAIIDLQAMMSGGMEPGMMGNGGGPDIDAMFAKAYRDSDEALSRSEFNRMGKGNPAAMLLQQDGGDAAFGRIDSDGNGSLSKDEISSFAESMKSQLGKLMGGGGSSQRSEFMQAINAYRLGSNSGVGTDLTTKLLEMLGEQKESRGVTA